MNSRNLTGIGLLVAVLLAAGNEATAATLYVSQTSTNPTPPYATRDTAAHTIQEAVDVSSDGDTVLVAEGTYALTNQVTITKGILLRSDAGQDQTILDGQDRVRCLWISNSVAVVDRFTIRRGAGLDGADIFLAGGTVQNCTISAISTAGGASVRMIGSMLNNCVVAKAGGPEGHSLVYCSGGGLITGCRVDGQSRTFADKGGGVYLIDSELRNSTISGMFAAWRYSGAYEGAGVYAVASTISGCTITNNWAFRTGGGAYLESCTVDRCIIQGNTAGQSFGPAGVGGGVYVTNSVIRNSLIEGNGAQNGSGSAGDGTVPGFGGGVYLHGGSLVNCTVTENQAANAGGIYVESGAIRNSVLYFNSASSNANWYNVGRGSFDHTCTTPDPGGVGNIVADPQFVDQPNGNYRLAPTSPCIDAGINEPWMSGANDLDGNPRIVNGTVDLGAWEASWPRFAQPQVKEGILRSTIGGLRGQGTITVETSTDLIHWQPFQTNTITGDNFELAAPLNPASPQEFFRALIRP